MTWEDTIWKSFDSFTRRRCALWHMG